MIESIKNDPYFKKIIPYKQSGARLNFRVSQELFSSFDIDLGTQFLLRTLATTDLGQVRTLLDLGCGYGPLGLTLSKMIGDVEAHLVDRDALAVAYARQNADLNDIAGVESYGSLGYDDIQRRSFDLIVSNIPAKAGEAAITAMLCDAVWYLAPAGMVAVVVVTPLAPIVAQILDEVAEITFRKARPGHEVFFYRFRERPEDQDRPVLSAFERGKYDRSTAELRWGATDLRLKTVYGLSEWESPSYETEMLLDGISHFNLPLDGQSLVFNPGQGYTALGLWQSCRPKGIVLADRDLLALRTTRHNLISNGYPSEHISLAHQAGFEQSRSDTLDLLTGVIREDTGIAVLEQMTARAAVLLRPDGMALFSGSSTQLTRIVTALRVQKLLRVEERRRKGGNSQLLLRRVLK